MHILVGLIAIISFVAIWYWRLKMMSGAAREGAELARTAANLPRRLAFKRKSGKTGLRNVTDPREAAAVMMLEIARTRGSLSEAQEAAIFREMRDYFDFSQDDAEALLAQAGWLLRESPAPHAVMSRMSDVVLRAPGMGGKELDDLASMLENVALADGHVSPEETDLIAIWRRKANLI